MRYSPRDPCDESPDESHAEATLAYELAEVVLRELRTGATLRLPYA